MTLTVISESPTPVEQPTAVTKVVGFIPSDPPEMEDTIVIDEAVMSVAPSSVMGLSPELSC